MVTNRRLLMNECPMDFCVSSFRLQGPLEIALIGLPLELVSGRYLCPWPRLSPAGCITRQHLQLYAVLTSQRI